jgi:hypothetical protein
MKALPRVVNPEWVLAMLKEKAQRFLNSSVFLYHNSPT